MNKRLKISALLCGVIIAVLLFSGCDILPNTESDLNSELAFLFNSEETENNAGATTSGSVTNNVGIKSTYINENGELIIKYTNGKTENLGVVVGKDGADGIDGENGKDGKDGIDGKDGVDGKDGLDGKDGIDGKDGKDGNSSTGTPDASDADDVSLAVSKGLRSSVSILCKYVNKETKQEYGSAGSGVIYSMNKESGSAFIITNHHVVYDNDCNTTNKISKDISVFLYGSEYSDMAIPAEYVGSSMFYDIAVLYIKDSEILKNSHAIAATFADSDKVYVGDTAIAIGNPEGAGIAASNGVVSVDSEHITMTAPNNVTEVDYRVMRIDTAVNSGNSGGGLFNSKGEIIGIVNAKIIDSSVENIGYAIPSNVALAVTQNLIDHCYGTDIETVQRCLLGITITIADSTAVFDTEIGKMYIEESVTIHEISQTSIAKGKLQEGDILISISINGNKKGITRQHHVIDFMLNARVGDEVTFEVERDGSIISKSVIITEFCITSY